MSKDKIIYDEKLEYQSLDSIMSDRFARYSKYIIQQRALPDVRDGLKPVQRRILYSIGVSLIRSPSTNTSLLSSLISRPPHLNIFSLVCWVRLPSWV